MIKISHALAVTLFGVSIVSNLIGLVGQFGANGFAGLVAMLILVGLYNGK